MTWFIVYGGTLKEVYQDSDLTVDFCEAATLEDLPEVIIRHHNRDNWTKIVEAELPEL